MNLADMIRMYGIAEVIRMFGFVPSTICSAEGDDPAGGGGTPADPQAPDNPATPDPPPDPPADPPPSDPQPPTDIRSVLAALPEEQRAAVQEDFNRIVGRARQEGRNAATRSTPTPPAPPATPATPPPATPPPSEPEPWRVEIDSLRAELSFKSLAMRHGLSDSQATRVYALYTAENPDDGDAWIQGLRDEGFLQASQQQRQGQRIPAPGGIQQAPVPGSPRKVTRLDAGGVINVFDLTDDEVANMTSEQIVENFEKAREQRAQSSGRPPVPAFLKKKG